MKNIILFIYIMVFIQVNLFSNDVVSGEYFFNIDPGVGNATPFDFTPGDSLFINTTFNSGTINFGNNILCIRVKDENGLWGFPYCEPFYLSKENISSNPKITSGELVFTINLVDPGVGEGIPFDIEDKDSLFSKFLVNIGDTPTGDKKVGLRFKDENGNWSFTKYKDVRVCSIDGTVPNFDYVVIGDTIFLSNKSENDSLVNWYYSSFGQQTKFDSVDYVKFVWAPPGMSIKLETINRCDTDSIKIFVPIDGIKDVKPSSIGNKGKSLLTIEGGGFTDSTRIFLIDTVGNEIIKIEADTIKFFNKYRIVGLFDFDNKPLGKYNVFVTNLKHIEQDVYRYEFEIVEHKNPSISLDVSNPGQLVNGQNLIRSLRGAIINVTIKNFGNIDAYNVPFFVDFEGGGSSVSFPFDLYDSNKDHYLADVFKLTNPSFNGSQTEIFFPKSFTKKDILTRALMINIPIVPANSSIEFHYEFIPSDDPSIELCHTMVNSMKDNGYPTQNEPLGQAKESAIDCINNLMVDAIKDKLIDEATDLIPFGDCVKEIFKAIAKKASENIKIPGGSDNKPDDGSIIDYVQQFEAVGVECMKATVGVLLPGSTLAKKVMEGIYTIYEFQTFYNEIQADLEKYQPCLDFIGNEVNNCLLFYPRGSWDPKKKVVYTLWVMKITLNQVQI